MMKPVLRQLIMLLTGTTVALAAMLTYFFAPIGWQEYSADWTAGPITPPNAAVKSSPFQFEDVTLPSGVNVRHGNRTGLIDIRQVMAPGIGLDDLDGDGLVDIFLVNSTIAHPSQHDAADNEAAGNNIAGNDIAPESHIDDEPQTPDDLLHGRENALFLNRGGMRFDAVPNAGGATRGEWAMGCAIADYDLDGDKDIFVTALGPNRLYENDGRAAFEEVGSAKGVDDAGWSTGAAFADYDLDGDLDLYVANYLQFDQSLIPDDNEFRSDRGEPPAFSPYLFTASADSLLRNDDGLFQPASESAGIASDGGKGMAVSFADLNRDRLPDLLVVNDVSFNTFFHNLGGGKFEDAGEYSGLADPRSGMGVAIGDYDNDGSFDIFSTHWQDESNVLYRNLLPASRAGEKAFFEDVTIKAGMGAPSLGHTGWGASWADFDLDGDLDLLVVNGYTSPSAANREQCIGQPVMLFENVDGRFTDHASDAGFAPLAQWAARGAATADLDEDGDVDAVIATNNGPVFIMENRLEGGRWLKVRPTGGNTIGAVVTVESAQRSQVRLLLGGTSYLCAEPQVAHFGMGDDNVADRIEIQWPDGTTQSLADVPVNQTVVLRKPE